MTPGNVPAGRFRAGDQLRALAALGVVVTHAVAAVVLLAPASSTSAAVVGSPLSHLANGLSATVYLFFVLSGYLVAGPFVRAFVTGSRRPGTSDYLRNRLLRIVPLFWVAAGVTLLVFGHRAVLGTEHHRDFSAFDVVAIFGFFQQLHFSAAAVTLGQAWTLHVEMVFYLCIPAVAMGALVAQRLGRRTRTALIVAVLAGIWIASAALRAQSHEWTGWLGASSFACSVWAFLPGVAIALIETTRFPGALAAGAMRRLPLALAVVGGATFLLLIIRADLSPAGQTSWATTFLLSIASCALVAAPLAQQWAGPTSWRALDNRVLDWLGRRSYGIYLLHVLVILLIAPVIGDATDSVALRVVLVLAAGVVLTVFLADLAWRFVEQPFLRLRSRPYGRTAGIQMPAPEITLESPRVTAPLAAPTPAAPSAP